MDFSVSDEDRAFNDRLSAYLDEKVPGGLPKDRTQHRAWRENLAAMLADDGWAMPAWPKEWGGMDLPLSQQYLYHREFALRGYPPFPAPSGNIVGPTLIKYGTEEQKKRYLRPLMRCEEKWAQGFSEPGAGSDLPSLRTRAVRDGDEYVVNGQKVWTSGADQSDMMYALVRTGTTESRERGISYLIIDMKTPGIEARPLRDMAGGARFCEVFFTDVRVPVQNRVGEENGGWPIARTALGHERSTSFIAASIRYRRVVNQLFDMARTRGVTGDPLLRQKLADLEIRVRLLELNGMRTLSNVLRHGEPGPGSSITRLFHSAFEQDLHDVAVQVLGSFGYLDPKNKAAVERGRWVWGFLETRASTIGAGTTEIQRNTIAEKVLGLPHDVALPGRNVPA